MSRFLAWTDRHQATMISLALLLVVTIDGVVAIVADIYAMGAV